MKSNQRKIIIASIIAFCCTALALLSVRVGIVDRWENQSHDVLYRDFQKAVSPDETVIIAIDQNSLDYFQTQLQILWPWPRDIYAIMTEYLTSCGARAIAYDIIFASPDIDRLNVSAEYADSAFALQMQASGKVILASQMEDSTRGDIVSAVDKFNTAIRFDVPPEIVQSYPRATLPLMRFQRTMAHPGAVNFFTEDDGVCRNLPLIFRYNDQYYPYMALSAALLYDGIDEVTYDESSSLLVFGERRVPLRKDGGFEVYWYGPGGPGHTFHYVSFAQVVNSYLQWKSGQKPDIPPDVFRDKAVFIGATAAGLLDLKTTPYSPVEPYPGVEVYATIFSNIVRGDYVRNFSVPLWMIVSLLLLFVLAFIWQKLKIWQSAVISLIFFFMPLALAVRLFQANKIFLPIVSSELAIVLTIIAVLVINYLTEGREKRLVKKVFNRYLHPAVVESLTENPEKLEMGGKEIHATVLFSDLQGFTGISELFTPPEIVKFLNEYFEKVEQIIFDNNGMLDKYTGDGIMAVFGAPVETPDHALMTCHAALGFKRLSALKIEAKGYSIPLITRVGINSGHFVVGNIGSSTRMDYTAIGDTVNLSARLEGVNKIYGTQNVISETTYELVKDQILCREIDHIRVKGRDKPLGIYTVYSLIEDADDTIRKFLSAHEEALSLYHERKFIEAAAAYRHLAELDADDPVAKVFIKRCEQLQTNPDLIDEHGVFNITTK